VHDDCVKKIFSIRENSDLEIAEISPTKVVNALSTLTASLSRCLVLHLMLNKRYILMVKR
jgi:hypothetical protein